MGLTKNEQRATKIGSVVVLVALVGIFAIIASIDLGYASWVDEGSLVPDAIPVWSTNETGDLLNTPAIMQIGCGPLEVYSYTGNFNATSTLGDGLAYNTTGTSLKLCLVGSATYRVFYQTTLTGQDILDMGAKVISAGILVDETIPINATGTLTYGVVNPLASATTVPVACISCTPLDVNDGEETLIPMTSDLVAFFATYADDNFAVMWQSDQDDRLAAYPEEIMQMDVTVYGDGLVAVEGTGDEIIIVTDITQAFGPDQILIASYLGVALLTTIGAALIWPSMTMEKMEKKIRRSR